MTDKTQSLQTQLANVQRAVAEHELPILEEAKTFLLSAEVSEIAEGLKTLSDKLTDGHAKTSLITLFGAIQNTATVMSLSITEAKNRLGVA